jgi:rRNA maturation RNase YbeY
MYLGRYSATDVISFDLSGNKKEFLADIAVSVDTAILNARIYKTSTLCELSRYVIHGILHLAGYDDGTKKQRKIMHEKTNLILAKLNIT